MATQSTDQNTENPGQEMEPESLEGASNQSMENNRDVEQNINDINTIASKLELDNDTWNNYTWSDIDPNRHRGWRRQLPGYMQTWRNNRIIDSEVHGYFTHIRGNYNYNVESRGDSCNVCVCCDCCDNHYTCWNICLAVTTRFATVPAACLGAASDSE